TTRWLLYIQEYDFEIKHCKGKENVVADVLSRHPTDIDSSDITNLQHELEINKIQMQISTEARKEIQNICTKQLNNHKLSKIIKQIKEESNVKILNKYKYYN